MKAAVDISLYPLNEDFKKIILSFIARLNTVPSITVETNQLSTQLVGDYDEIMRLLNTELKTVFFEQKAVAVLKIVGRPGEI